MSEVRGHVCRVRPGTWQFQVIRDGKIIATDNTGSWRPVYDECRRVVAAFQIVARRGHITKPKNREHRDWLASLTIGSAS